MSCADDDDDDDDDEDEALASSSRRRGPLSIEELEAQRDMEAIREVEQSSKKRQKCACVSVSGR